MTPGKRERSSPRLPKEAPLEYAPEGEIGVVFLFAMLARRRYGIHVEKVRANFPDCIATKGGERITIEFEHRSSNYARHRHPEHRGGRSDEKRAADYIVCWEHDWARKPEHIQVIELRREYGLGFNVWLLPVAPESATGLPPRRTRVHWSVPPRASEGDLLVVYRSQKDRAITDLFETVGPVRYYKRAPWKARRGLANTEDWQADIRRVVSLRAPLHLAQLERHRVLRDAGFVRGRMRGRPRISEYWPELLQLIVRLNPSTRRVLSGYGPERLD